MRALHTCVVAFTSLLLLSACASTQLTVRKVQDGSQEPNGVRYSLPKPFLLVTPSPSGDGSLKVDVVYLPDSGNTYAIDGRTKRGKYELSVNVKDGLLSKVAWSQKDAALAAESIRVATEVAKGQLERQQDEEKERAKQSGDERKAADEEIQKLQAELDERELALQLLDFFIGGLPLVTGLLRPFFLFVLLPFELALGNLGGDANALGCKRRILLRSEEHTSELQSPS